MIKLYIVFVGLLGVVGDAGRDGGAVLLREVAERHPVGSGHAPRHDAYIEFREVGTARFQKVPLKQAVKVTFEPPLSGQKLQVENGFLKMSLIAGAQVAPEDSCIADQDGQLGECKKFLAARVRGLRGTAKPVHVFTLRHDLWVQDGGKFKVSRSHDVDQNRPGGAVGQTFANGILVEADVPEGTPLELKIGGSSYRLEKAKDEDLVRIGRQGTGGYVVWVHNRPEVDFCQGQATESIDFHYPLLYDFVRNENVRWAPVVEDVCASQAFEKSKLAGLSKMERDMIEVHLDVAPGSQCITPELN